MTLSRDFFLIRESFKIIINFTYVIFGIQIFNWIIFIFFEIQKCLNSVLQFNNLATIISIA